jgi:hypothetical protein
LSFCFYILFGFLHLISNRFILLFFQSLLTLKQSVDDEEKERFVAYQPGGVLHDVFVPDLPPLLAARDDYDLQLTVDEAAEPPPLPCIVDQHEEIVIEPKKMVNSAIRNFNKRHNHNIAVGRGNVHVTHEESQGQVIGNALWEALNNRRKVIALSSEGEQAE